MPIPAVAILLAKVFGTAVLTSAVVFWPKIMGWVRAHLLPWVQRNLPSLVEDVRTALQEIDRVVVAVRNAVKTAWRRVRRVLLSEVAEFVRLFDDEWSLTITSWIANQEANEQPYTRIVTEQRLGYDDLPPEVRKAALRESRNEYTLDVTGMRDELILAAA